MRRGDARRQPEDSKRTRRDGKEVKSIITGRPSQAWGDDGDAANMVSTEAARGKAPLRAEAVLL